ncbi:MAG: hypothetical protein K2K37_04355 [Muribaculaceae bacterium]|nr:hypothetical protein [Muribaculaceae bacterium]
MSATISKSISRTVGLETGLSYTYLHSTLETSSYSSDCRWHYLGIPLKLSFTNYSTQRVRLYATVGVQLDIPLYSSAIAFDPQSADHLPDGRYHSSVVVSTSVSYGLNINLSRHIGIFIEPTLQYHFEHEYNIPNAWTDDKLVFSLPVGLRYNF